MSVRCLKDDLVKGVQSTSFFILVKAALISHSFHLVCLLRIGQSLTNVPIFGAFFRVLIEYLIRVVYASDISCRSKIGSGFTIVHGHDIVIGSDVVIGCGCKIFNGVTLGNKDMSALSYGNQPRVGNGVIISTGAKILGPITISDHVVIGANSVVIDDCPEGAIVVGVPGRVVRCVHESA